VHSAFVSRSKKPKALSAPSICFSLREFPALQEKKFKKQKKLQAGTAVCYQDTTKMMTHGNAGWVVLVFLALVCTGSF
jgi:hypothetical protein